MSLLKLNQLYNEQELITLLRNGSQFAFERLFENYSQKLYRFSYSYLKSETESEEIVQDVFLKLWEKRDKLRNETSFQSYLFTIAFNAIRKHFNKKVSDLRYRSEIIEFFSIENPSIEVNPDFEMMVVKLELLIDKMPSRRKDIFIKRKKEGQSIRDIANELDISPKTVENQITEAMNYLRKEFDKDQISKILFFCLVLIFKNLLYF